jgi:hypothetical protein
MKTNHECADRLIRKTSRARRLSYKPSRTIQAQKFDAVAYAAALEVLG